MRGHHWSIPAFLLVAGAAHAADDKRADTTITSPAGLSAEAARMYVAVKKPHPGELKWQTIPWLTDLAEGIRQAKDEKRPLLLWVSGDDPLEKC